MSTRRFLSTEESECWVPLVSPRVGFSPIPFCIGDPRPWSCPSGMYRVRGSEGSPVADPLHPSTRGIPMEAVMVLRGMIRTRMAVCLPCCLFHSTQWIPLRASRPVWSGWSGCGRGGRARRRPRRRRWRTGCGGWSGPWRRGCWRPRRRCGCPAHGCGGGAGGAIAPGALDTGSGAAGRAGGPPHRRPRRRGPGRPHARGVCPRSGCIREGVPGLPARPPTSRNCGSRGPRGAFIGERAFWYASPVKC